MSREGIRAPEFGTGRAAAAAVVAAGAGVAGGWAYSRVGGSDTDVLRDVTVGWAYAGAGLAAWWRRPGNWTGPLMLAEGVSWFLGNLQGTGVPLLFGLGAWGEALNMAILAHLVLAFPDGRLTGRPARWLTGFCYLLAVVGGLLRAMTFDPAVAGDATYLDCSSCGPNPLLVPGLSQWFPTVDVTYRALGFAVSLIAVAVIVRRWRHASVARRRALLPAWLSVAIATGFLVWNLLVYTLPGLDGALEQAGLLLADLAQVSVPLAFLAGLLRMQLQRAEVSGLVLEVGTAPPPGRLREVLARVLGDPGLRLGVWREEHGNYVDYTGHPVPDGGPGATRVDSSRGTPLALLRHEPALADDPALLDSVSAALRLGLENVWLRTEAREVTSRIVRAADSERQKLERDLHDGAQARLVFALAALRRVEKGVDDHPDAELRRSVGEVERSLRLALDELRGIAHGIHPAVLSREGLGPALTELAETASLPVVVTVDDVRFDPVVESTAYFAVCEALSNSAKHARAKAVSVSARQRDGRLVVETVDDGVGGADTARGQGLRGLADRLAAVDGVLELDSPAGGGTRVRVELPCG